MVAPGPSSEINREYFAQNNGEAIEKGLVGTEEYEQTDDKARELLQRLAQSKPYFRKGRQVDEGGKPLSHTTHGAQKRLGAPGGGSLSAPSWRASSNPDPGLKSGAGSGGRSWTFSYRFPEGTSITTPTRSQGLAATSR
ncbi:hypothetical protein SPBR_05387 [Sporothrix brasiliensis 5110]|uniref:Uncharacterized protein n=1 Tax=Sporothrix brasiliensis 5110 TaxID=1398154 RepID=A0A0C2IJR6_9PEZI|nr:uncharacterized protein SPBR_05387 [Sporothrix brasiliensis 5110]KIH87185.1 hypothetical protein SPBR_05387 [Sporothrix brasiliensis 5110]